MLAPIKGSGKSFYDYGYGQAIGGGLNDVASFVVTGGTGGVLNPNYAIEIKIATSE